MTEIEKPHRGRWKRWVWVGLCVLVAAGLIVPPILREGAEKQIRLRIERYQATGEPVTVADLGTQPVNEADNAVTDLRRAAAIVSAYARANDAWVKSQQFVQDDTGTQEELSIYRKIVSDNRPPIALVDAAMKKKSFCWPSQPTSPLMTWMLPDLSPQRDLLNLMMIAARMDAGAGDDAAAADDVLRGLFVARAMSHHPQAVVVSLVAEAMQQNVCKVVVAIGPTMKIGDGVGEARPEQIGRIIGELLDDTIPRETARRGYFAERVMMLDAADGVLTGRMSASALVGSGGASPVGVLFSPAGRYFTGSWMLSDVAVILDVDTAFAQAVDIADWPTAKQRVTHLYDPFVKMSLKHVWAQMLMPNLERSLQTVFRGRAYRRLAAVVLAARWYASEHGGNWPPTLDALVPKYLPAVPNDPFAAGVARLQYIFDAKDPRVYSVGENGVDEGGAEKPVKGSARDLWGMPDAVVHLRGE